MAAEFFMPLCFGGGAGVVVFFLVSGYIISHVIGKECATVFVIKRFFRIYPLFVLAVVIEVLLARVTYGTPWPAMSEFVPRILLLGDFFGVPYVLGGVEWTLRIEIMFYFIVFLCKLFGVIEKPRLLIFVYFFIIISLQFFGPFSINPVLSKGYITLYMPFLFMGACFYLHEKYRLGGVIMLGLYIVVSYLVFLPRVNPHFINSNFAVYGCLVFFMCWVYREKNGNSIFLVFFSDLTYSIYLLHNWLWVYIDLYFVKPESSMFSDKVKTAVVLFVVCALVHELYEKRFVKIGSVVSRGLSSCG